MLTSLPAVRFPRLLLTCLAVVLVATTTTSAGAATDDARARRDAARDTKAQLAAKLDALNASEKDLLAAQGVLDEQVRTQNSLVSSAQQAAGAASAELAEVSARLTDTTRRIDGLTRSFVDRAVEEYMAPRSDAGSAADDPDLASRARRQALAATVAATGEDLLDQLRAAKQDRESERAEAEALQRKAAGRLDEANRRLQSLRTAQADQARVTAAVETRRRAVLAQIDAETRSEAQLNQVIAARERSRPVTVSGPGGATGCIWPVDGTVTSEYGPRWGRVHAGIDIAGPIGTPIRAAKPGEVVFAGAMGGYGLIVIIAHAGGMETRYAHMNSVAVSDGQQVNQGDVIGARGNTGQSTGPHLHFETRSGGTPQNPRGCLG